jgi:hypothetical protein
MLTRCKEARFHTYFVPPNYSRLCQIRMEQAEARDKHLITHTNRP